MRRSGLQNRQALAWLSCLLVVLSGQALAAAGLTAEEIIARVDANSDVQSSHGYSTMVIRTGRRELTKEMEIWSSGDNALVSFHNPADRGTKYLKLGNELWMYFPDADDLVKISGHMLRQGFMGSDFSYEDTLENRRLTDLYEFSLLGVEECDESECYVLEATARPGVEVTYARRRMWIDRELFVPRREELYAAGGRLLKVSRVERIEEIDGRFIPTQVTMEDVLRQGSSTTLFVSDLELDVEIPDDLFSLRSLMR
ncbi:MAG: outer membrane lipoprotein-sorting protein [Firmicutes bacterium]|nr:outer membrane lipoprotein-sorting protein [Bacillota bacterium]